MTSETPASTLRDRIRRAICEAEGFAWDSDMLEPDEYGDVADLVLAALPDTAPAAGQPDTLPAWLHQRFRSDKAGWDDLTADDQAYWAHEAAAVRRAVARGGFKIATGPFCSAGLLPQGAQPIDFCTVREPHTTHRTDSGLEWTDADSGVA